MLLTCIDFLLSCHSYTPFLYHFDVSISGAQVHKQEAVQTNSHFIEKIFCDVEQIIIDFNEVHQVLYSRVWPRKTIALKLIGRLHMTSHISRQKKVADQTL